MIIKSYNTTCRLLWDLLRLLSSHQRSHSKKNTLVQYIFSKISCILFPNNPKKAMFTSFKVIDCRRPVTVHCAQKRSKCMQVKITMCSTLSIEVDVMGYGFWEYLHRCLLQGLSPKCYIIWIFFLRLSVGGHNDENHQLFSHRRYIISSNIIPCHWRETNNEFTILTAQISIWLQPTVQNDVNVAYC